ncbi:MAG: tripartite tricarboxylate transporter TctB family protein [Propylenella sp.]
MILSGRILTTLVMLVIFAGMSVMAIGYPEKARFLPLLVGIPGTIMCLAQLLIDIRHAFQQRAGDAEADSDETADASREAKMLLWLVLFFAGILAFGFLFGAPVIVAAYLRFAERETWTTSLVAGVGAWLVLYVVFVRLLELYVFDGLVTQLILG